MNDGSHQQQRTDGNAPRSVRELPAKDAIELRRRGEDVVYLDVRENHEWNLFRIPGALHLPLAGVRERAPALIGRERRVIVYCARGSRAAEAAGALLDLGYVDVASIAGGVMGWLTAGGELEE